jgi:hypothetical protein
MLEYWTLQNNIKQIIIAIKIHQAKLSPTKKNIFNKYCTLVFFLIRVSQEIENVYLASMLLLSNVFSTFS